MDKHKIKKAALYLLMAVTIKATLVTLLWMVKENLFRETFIVMMVNGRMGLQMVMEFRLINRIKLNIKVVSYLGLKQDKDNIHGKNKIINMLDNLEMD